MERGTRDDVAAAMNTDWEQRYRTGDMPWEKGAPHPAIVEFLQRVPMRGRVFVPGCGTGHDVRAIAATADEVVGLDIAPSAIAAAKNQLRIGGEDYFLGDLFALPAEMRSAFDWVVEHTCFCAISPTMRGDYVRAVASALKPGGRLFGVFYLTPKMDPGEEGPPFGTSIHELDKLFAPHFATEKEWVPTATYPGRKNRELCRVLVRLPA